MIPITKYMMTDSLFEALTEGIALVLDNKKFVYCDY